MKESDSVIVTRATELRNEMRKLDLKLYHPPYNPLVDALAEWTSNEADMLTDYLEHNSPNDLRDVLPHSSVVFTAIKKWIHANLKEVA